MKLNQNSCYLLVSGYKHENIRAQIGEVIIWEGSRLRFNEYVSSLCKKACWKMSVSSRLSNLMSFNKEDF